MKQYEELKGKCKDCYVKCFRVEDYKFKGVQRCEYYSESPKIKSN